MQFNIETFLELKLTPDSYLLLYAIVHEDKELITILNTQINTFVNGQILERLGYIKLQADKTWILRSKALSLQTQIKPEINFDKFWDEYHLVTGQKKTDLQASIKYWKKLTKSEKQLAIDNIKPYFNSLPIYSTGRPVKKARTYLGDKNFNDEFEVKVKSRSINEMI